MNHPFEPCENCTELKGRYYTFFGCGEYVISFDVDFPQFKEYYDYYRLGGFQIIRARANEQKHSVVIWNVHSLYDTDWVYCANLYTMLKFDTLKEISLSLIIC